MRDVPFLPAARTEFLQALDSYAAEDSTLAADFLNEVERASQRISTFPEVAIAHHRRRPGYWLRRIRNRPA